MSKTGIWENFLVLEVMDALKKDSKTDLIDIGANIGVFSLLAAKAGHKVVAVEPIKDNIIRYQKVYSSVRVRNVFLNFYAVKSGHFLHFLWPTRHVF